jgi:hypothetical protein
MNSGLDVLKAMKREWTPEKYVPGALAVNSFGVKVNPDDSNAVAFCASGMLHKLAGSNFSTTIDLGNVVPCVYNEAAGLLHVELIDLYNQPGYGITGINDSEGGYEKIMAAVDRILVREAPKTEVAERELVAV